MIQSKPNFEKKNLFHTLKSEVFFHDFASAALIYS